MDETVEILKRIESQYLTILRAITPKVRGKYVSVDDAAEQLNRSAWTIRQLCNCNQINAVKGNDGRWQIPREEVTRLEEEGVPRLAKRCEEGGSALQGSMACARRSKGKKPLVPSSSLATSA
jgi:hypothetical protein